MPELPEVETVCRGLAILMEGRRLVRVDVRRPDMRIPFPTGLAKALTGRRIDKIRRLAKYILMDLDDANVVIAHLGMSGRMAVTPLRHTPPGPHDHVVMITDDGSEIRFNDPRRFGLMTLAPAADIPTHRFFAGLGPDPLEASFTPEVLSAALKGRATSIKAALLDQRIVAGLGNIYVSESLYRAGISPKRKSSSVAGRRAEALVPAIKQVLGEAVAAGGSSLRDHVQPSGELGYFQHQWKVYDRDGATCPRHGQATDGHAAKPVTIRRIVQGGRSTYYCPKCQT